MTRKVEYPAFARLAAGRTATAVPLTVGGRPVAVVYADDGVDGSPVSGWMDAVDMLVRHGSATIGLRTATRTLDVIRGNAAGDRAGGEGSRGNAKLL